MTSHLPPYLSSLNNIPGLVADFIGRIPGIEVDTDKWGTLARLKPFHDSHIESLGFNASQLALAEQVHGAEIVDVSGLHEFSSYSPGVDGLIHDGQSPCLLGIYVADCAAVWLYDKETGAMALLHSGKKGTEGNITGRALAEMTNRFQTDPANVLAVISPCIRPPLYEFDIPSALLHQLRDAGVHDSHIFDSGLCTGSDLDSFYSYRVEKGSTGRMLALLGKR